MTKEEKGPRMTKRGGYVIPAFFLIVIPASTHLSFPCSLFCHSRLDRESGNTYIRFLMDSPIPPKPQSSTDGTVSIVPRFIALREKTIARIVFSCAVRGNPAFIKAQNPTQRAALLV